MSTPAERFVRDAPGVRSAELIQTNKYLNIYHGEVDESVEDIVFHVLAPDVNKDTHDAFKKSAHQWQNPSTHPNIVRVFTQKDEPRPWIAVEKLGGQSLDTAQSELTLREVHTVITDAADALRNAILYNTIHLSLAPTCVWIAPGEEGPRGIVGEWGLERACRVAAGERPITPFTAPELLTGPRSGSEQTDVYGLGAVAYYALTGQPPVPSEADLETAISSGERSPPSATVESLPSAVDDVVIKALAPKAGNRFDSVYSFGQAFDRALKGSIGPPPADKSLNSSKKEQTNTATAESTGLTDESETESASQTAGSELVSRRRALATLGIGAVGLGATLVADNYNIISFGIVGESPDIRATEDQGFPRQSGGGNDGTVDDGTGNGATDDRPADSGGGGDSGPTTIFNGDGEINFNISPSVPQEQLDVQYAPLRDHLQSYITENYDTPDGLEASMNVGTNYSAVIQTLGQGTADLAETGPLAAVVGNQTGNSEIILQRYGYGSWTYKSLIAVPNGSDISSVADLEGKDVAFSDPLSTSGFLFPVAAMAEAGIDIGELPEGNGSRAAFTPRFAGGHVQSYTLLEQGQVDAAGMGGFVRDTSTGPAPDAWQDVATTLHEDTGIPRAPIIVSPELPEESKDAIQQAFLEGPDSIYYGADGEEGTDDDLWFGDVREATIDDYQIFVDKAGTLGIDPSFFE